MYFKKLEIFGFKSFADKTILNFEPGITAVVGPNGCGKSNIFDSIRWVLGEQSIRELRGSSKEDVIFNGTQNKPALGFAEVSLTFSNEQRMLPIEYDEVTITRRLFRSGESEYLLNKIVVRLKDIQELLMGTGIGAEAYSLIQQGKVDLIVSAKPEDRRVIFDEASGITKYKAKKREALNKLKDTENNLLRINDIVVEVKRQIASVERQAKKAVKYKAEFEKLKVLEVCFAREEIDLFTDQKNEINQQLKDLKQAEWQLNGDLEKISATLTDEINYLDGIEQKINAITTENIKLDGQIDLSDRQIGFNEERIEDLRINEQRSTEKKEQLIDQCRTQQQRVEELKQSLVTLQETMQYSEQSLIEKKESLTLLERSIREARERIKEDEEKTLGLTSNQVNIRNALTDVMKKVEGALARKRRLELENDKVLSEKEEVAEKLKNCDQQAADLRQKISESQDTRNYKSEELNTLKAKLTRIEEHIDELEKKTLFLKSQKEFIEKLHTQYQDIPDPVVTGRFLTQTPPLEHHTGIIGKVKEVRKQESAQELYEIICETKFIELDPQQISLKIEEIEKEVEHLKEERDGLKDQIQGLEFEFEQIEQEIRTQEKLLSILEAQRQDILAEIKKLEGELELVESELMEVKEALVSARKKEEELDYKLETVNQDIGWCQNDVKEKRAWIVEKAQEKEEFVVTIAQIGTELEAGKEKLEREKHNEVLFAETLDRSLEEIKRIDNEVGEQKDKREGYLAEMEILKQAIEGIKEQKETLKQELNEYNAQKEEVGLRINATRTDMVSIEEEIDQIKQKQHDQQMNNQKLGFSETGIRERLMQAYKIDLEEASQAYEEISEESQIMLPEGATLKEEIERLAKRCDSFGSVNLVAIEEHQELKERFEFLTKQQSDLIEARSKLLSTITKINRSTRQMFMDTFTKVSEEFRIYFRMLFGGGEAELVLLDPENVLESGIDIVARPKGKKLQNISLLSGGEKTLTAIALIFGVFKVNPSPFCVLDEIDAALDESNVGRFSYLLKDFSKIAQFIVITHNKKTMNIADVMYGITMPETGISRVVSVKFSEKEKEEKELLESVGV